MSLAERLGFAPDATLVIFNCDDLGSTRSANVAIYDALRTGIATSATVMVPCPWARDAAAMYDGEDVGVHLTLNAEWQNYRWGPLTAGSSLVDDEGELPRTQDEVWDNADIDEVRAECRAQIQRAIDWGFDITHIDSHMGTMQLRAEFFDLYVELAKEFALPLRMAGASAEEAIGFPYRSIAEAAGVVFPDHFILTQVGSKAAIERAFARLRPGVTEMYLHPAVDSDELRASHPDWPQRVDDHAILTSDDAVRELITHTGAVPISFRGLRDLQRSG